MSKRTAKDRVGSRIVNLDVFYRNQKSDSASGCSIWTGMHTRIGYPFIGFRDTVTDKTGLMTAHRLSLMIKLGRDIEPGMNANHTCHVRNCVAQDHLYEGTQAEKMASMAQDNKLDRGLLRGSYHHKQARRNYVYSEAEVIWAREATNQELMAKYNIPTTKLASDFRGRMRRSYVSWLPWENPNPRRRKRIPPK
jgi:hypothetical protein